MFVTNLYPDVLLRTSSPWYCDIDAILDVFFFTDTLYVIVSSNYTTCCWHPSMFTLWMLFVMFYSIYEMPISPPVCTHICPLCSLHRPSCMLIFYFYLPIFPSILWHSVIKWVIIFQLPPHYPSVTLTPTNQLEATPLENRLSPLDQGDTPLVKTSQFFTSEWTELTSVLTGFCHNIVLKYINTI